MKTRVLGSAIFIKSAIKVEDMEYAVKYNPELLTQKDEEGNAIYRADLGAGRASISTYGITFDRKTEDGFVAMQTTAPGTEKKDVEATIKAMANALKALKDFEAYFNATVAALKAEHKATVAEVEFINVEEV